MLSGVISMKLDTNNHHMLERFSRSEVKGQGHSEIRCTFSAEAYVLMVCGRGLLVEICACWHAEDGAF